MHPHGSLDGGLEDGQVFQGSIASARLHELEHKVLSGAQVNDRYPGYHLLESSRAVFQPEGGYVKSELGIVTHVQAAQAAGADIRARERVLGWEARPGGEGVVVNTARGRYEAGRLILAAGAWMADLVPVLRGIAVPERQVLAWLQPTAPALFTPERFPVFNLEVAEGRYYGLPVVDIPGFSSAAITTVRSTCLPRQCVVRWTQRIKHCCAPLRRAIFWKAMARPWRCAPACSPTRRTSTFW